MTSHRPVAAPIAAGILCISLCGCRVMISSNPLPGGIPQTTQQSTEPTASHSWLTRRASAKSAQQDPFLNADASQPAEPDPNAWAKPETPEPANISQTENTPSSQTPVSSDRSQGQWQKTRPQ